MTFFERITEWEDRLATERPILSAIFEGAVLVVSICLIAVIAHAFGSELTR